MTTLEERARRRKIAEDKHYLAVLRSQTALINGWKCPVCKREFACTMVCHHTWADVADANDKFLLELKNR